MKQRPAKCKTIVTTSMENHSQQYILWLMPEPEMAEQLSGLILKIADENGSEAFEPHITLASRLPPPHAKRIRFMFEAELTREIALELKYDGLKSSNDYYKGLYLEVMPQRQLGKLRSQLERFITPSLESFEPHISCDVSDAVLDGVVRSDSALTQLFP